MTDRLKEAEKRLTNNICSEADTRYLLALCKTAKERLGPAGFKLLEELNQLRERVKVLEDRNLLLRKELDIAYAKLERLADD